MSETNKNIKNAPKRVRKKAVKTIKQNELPDNEPIEDVKVKPIEEVKNEPIEEVKDEPIEDVKDEPIEEVKELLENEETEQKVCTKCGHNQNITCFKNIKTQSETKTCANCRKICYRSYRNHDGFGKNSSFTKNKQIEYLCDIINKEVHSKKLSKYDKLNKFHKFEHIVMKVVDENKTDKN